MKKNSKDSEELIAIKLTKYIDGYYRIIRNDGGFDSGLVALESEINAFVDLLEGEINVFQLKIYNKDQEVLAEDLDIKIHQGKYQIQGQLLPNDICLEIDDLTHQVTRLEAIFKKNNVLPLKKTLYKTASKTILKDSADSLKINIVEGDHNGLPSAALSIGYIAISGAELEQDLIKGTDIELEISVTESRDIVVGVFLSACDQEFKNTFKPTERYISASKMENDIRVAIKKIEKELQSHEENYELLAKFKKINEALIELQIELSLLEDSDVTDTKFKIDNSKRNLILQYDQLTRHKDLDVDISEYKQQLEQVALAVKETEGEFYKSQFQKIKASEKTVLNSGNKYLIRSKIEELNSLSNTLFHLKDENFINPFIYYKLKEDEYPDKAKAQILIEQGDRALDRQQFNIVKHVVYQLAALLPGDNNNEIKLGNNDKTGLQ